MTRFVVDASVVVKWVVAEPDSAHATALLAVGLAAPDWVLAEAGNALRKRVRRDDIPSAQATSGLAAVAGSGLALYASAPLAVVALKISLELNHPVYDCVYLALAERLQVPVVTADARLAELCAATSRAALVLRLAEAAGRLHADP